MIDLCKICFHPPRPISTFFILSHTDSTDNTDFVCLAANGSHTYISHIQFSNVLTRKQHLFFVLFLVLVFGDIIFFHLNSCSQFWCTLYFAIHVNNIKKTCIFADVMLGQASASSARNQVSEYPLLFKVGGFFALRLPKPNRCKALVIDASFQKAAVRLGQAAKDSQ
jgi:hypothetical protein